MQLVAKRIVSVPLGQIQRVAIDGVDGAGKSTFAKKLTTFVENLGRPVIHSTVDGFHNPRDIRFKNGKGPESFYYDSYNYSRLKEVLLDPLSPKGNLNYIPEIFNVDKNESVAAVTKLASGSEVLIFDGIFLHRPELRDYWDYSISLDVTFENSIPRGAQRGGSSPEILAPSNERYIGGQKIYLSECRPQARASMLIVFNNLDSPKIIRAS